LGADPLQKIFGIDIIPTQRSEGGMKRYFALVILSDNNVLKTIDKISLMGLLRLVKKEKPQMLAIDNIFELHEDKAKLVRILSYLSLYTRVVQVTRKPEGDEPLLHIAKKIGLLQENVSKLNPIQTAEIAARLAERGVGSFVSVNENETKIVVSPGRVFGAGGSSSRRYQRYLSQMVLRTTRKIEESLKAAGIEYDLYVRKTEGGLKNGVFIVYAPRDKLRGVVKQRRGHDVKVSIRPLLKGEIEFIPLKSSYGAHERLTKPPLNHIIVGLDPGISTGVAVLTVKGQLLSLMTSRNLGRNTLIKFLMQYGKPILIATDVNPPPTYTKKIAAYFNATLFYPPHSLSIEEKRRLVQDYSEKYKIKVADSHQRDALAAAIKALSSFEDKFMRLEKEVSRRGLNVNLADARAFILKGKTVKEALDMALSSEKTVLHRKVEPPKADTSRQVREELEEELRKKIKEIQTLRVKIEELEKRLEEKEREIKDVKNRYEELLGKRASDYIRERFFRHLVVKIDKMRKENTKLQSMLNKEREKVDTLKNLLEDAVKGNLEYIFKFDEIEGKNKTSRTLTIFVEKIDESIIDEIINIHPKAVLAPPGIVEPLSRKLELYNIPTISLEEAKVSEVDGKYYVRRNVLESIIREKRSELKKKYILRSQRELEKILEEYRERRKLKRFI